MKTSTFHYVHLSEVLDRCRLGWIARPHILTDTHHGNMAMMMEWLCDCQMVKPVRVGMVTE